ncbi:HlyD family secretion protein [Mesorhizobium amorphae]|uniref:Secretion protein HlyD family protein n=1 Tax=Mesorhizobium amorphae CCNWGS0123 TaxID=1082933 RepID=G6YE64_9HYPH|nr:HlyD family secretion protein [Mesorhizobium amorphae]EHH10005.1 secretion protein HlyD family protein [Mesorhizobium amorphae CCNWGS0123]GLR39578.1 transporter [Mesorhizobium amorphae]
MASDATGTSQDNAVDGADTQTTKGNPLRRVALGVLLLACLLFVTAVFMERRTPSSSQATVSAYVVGIAPEVTGRVIEVGVADNSGVKPGQVLFRIDPQQYQLAVAEAEARLARVGQTIGASTASVDAVQARLVEARAVRDNVQEQANRAMELVKRGVYAKAKYDEAKAAVDQANASVVAAEADLKQAQEELGPAGADNPQLKEALAALERAQLDLLRTTVLAPAEGVVTNLQLSVGGVVGAGQSAITFIDVGTVWITAAFKENSLENVAAGNRADVLFDLLPGQVFGATVESVGMGVAQGSVDPKTGLPKISTESGWIRTPQSFPVRLILDEGRPKGVRYGSQANVVIYTGDNPVTNAIGRIWMRVLSVLTYVS